MKALRNAVWLVGNTLVVALAGCFGQSGSEPAMKAAACQCSGAVRGGNAELARATVIAPATEGVQLRIDEIVRPRPPREAVNGSLLHAGDVVAGAARSPCGSDAAADLRPGDEVLLRYEGYSDGDAFACPAYAGCRAAECGSDAEAEATYEAYVACHNACVFGLDAADPCQRDAAEGSVVQVCSWEGTPELDACLARECPVTVDDHLAWVACTDGCYADSAAACDAWRDTQARENLTFTVGTRAEAGTWRFEGEAGSFELHPYELDVLLDFQACVERFPTNGGPDCWDIPGGRACR